MSLSTLSFHHNRWRPLFLPSLLASYALFRMLPSSLLIICPNHLKLASRILSLIMAIFANRLISLMVRCSLREMPQIHLSIRISLASSSLSSVLLSAKVSIPYSNTGRITLLYNLILSLATILFHIQHNPTYSLHLAQAFFWYTPSTQKSFEG